MIGKVDMCLIDEGVARVTIDHPPVNALTAAMLRQLCDAFSQIGGDGSIRAVILIGANGVFCSGADLRGAGRDGAQALEPFGEMFEILGSLAIPVIAAIDGVCIGGGLELALCCDLRIATTRARFVCAGANMGLIASASRLPRLIGVGRAKAMLLTGLAHDAQTALDWGLVTALHAPDLLAGAALELAGRIASRAPLAVEAVKHVVDSGGDLDDVLILERQEARRLSASKDHAEAVAAFLGKRDPHFSRI